MDTDNEVNKENDKFSTFKLVWERSKKLIYSFIIFLLVTLIISAGIVIWVCISSKNTNTLLWTNYWVMVAAVIPIAGALLSFYFQFEMNEYTKNKEKYLNFQESVQKQQAPKFINFSKTRSPAQKLQLAKDLVALMYTSIDIDKKRISLGIDSDDPDISDLSDFNDRITQIIQDDDNSEIIAEVEKNYFDLHKFISDKNPSKFSDSEATNNKIVSDKTFMMNTEDEKILGYWILSQFRARNAKYLIGVSTKDKRILGVYELNGDVDVDENTKRVLFYASKRLYFDGDREPSVTMPKLDKWTAQNPVLYYKQYLKNKNFKLSPEDIDTINKVISPGKYDLLEFGDIIVVRTFKFDIK